MVSIAPLLQIASFAPEQHECVLYSSLSLSLSTVLYFHLSSLYKVFFCKFSVVCLPPFGLSENLASLGVSLFFFQLICSHKSSKCPHTKFGYYMRTISSTNFFTRRNDTCTYNKSLQRGEDIWRWGEERDKIKSWSKIVKNEPDVEYWAKMISSEIQCV